jgi:hypothetical protein
MGTTETATETDVDSAATQQLHKQVIYELLYFVEPGARRGKFHPSRFQCSHFSQTRYQYPHVCVSYSVCINNILFQAIF